jgi:hypothetical protein
MVIVTMRPYVGGVISSSGTVDNRDDPDQRQDGRRGDQLHRQQDGRGRSDCCYSDSDSVDGLAWSVVTLSALTPSSVNAVNFLQKKNLVVVEGILLTLLTLFSQLSFLSLFYSSIYYYYFFLQEKRNTVNSVNKTPSTASDCLFS